MMNVLVRTLCRLVRYSFIPLLLCILLNFAESFAQRIEPDKEKLDFMDGWIRSYMQEQNIPGGLVAVSAKGRLEVLRPYGMANVELKVPVTDSTVFEIGSVSKQFVSAAIMLFMQEGKLGLDDPVHHYLPYLPGEWLGITIRQLLTHTSGIPDYEEIESYDVYRFRLTPNQVIRIAHSRPLDFEPGTGWYYSNTGYFLASMIIETIEGQPLGQVLQSRIFAPLGMNQTRMASPEDIIPHRASGYWVDKSGKLINRIPTETSSTLGAGGLLSSAYDLVKWDQALYDNRLLSESTKQIWWAETILPNGDSTGYALGWNVRPYKHLEKQSHGGQVAGFVTRFSRFPEQETCIIVFMNRYRISSLAPSLAVLHTFMPALGPIPE